MEPPVDVHREYWSHHHIHGHLRVASQNDMHQNMLDDVLRRTQSKQRHRQRPKRNRRCRDFIHNRAKPLSPVLCCCPSSATGMNEEQMTVIDQRACLQPDHRHYNYSLISSHIHHNPPSILLQRCRVRANNCAPK